MNNQIKAGSVVQLKSGGPLMTVRWVDEDSLGTFGAYCEWFVQDKAPWKKDDHFYALPSLKVIEP